MSYKVDDIPTIRITTSMVHVSTDKEFTTVVLEGVYEGAPIGGMGTAKRNRGDKYNETVGRQLAMSRALRDLADEIEEMAHEADGSHS